MTRDEKGQFLKHLVRLGELYEAELSSARLEIYWEALSDLDGAAVMRELAGAPKWATFMPKPAEIRRRLERSLEEAAELAWRRLLRAVNAVGSGASVTFEDQRLHAAVAALGGWEAPTEWEWTPRGLDFRRQEFVRLYALGNRLWQPTYLMGWVERENRSTREGWTHGTWAPEVVVVDAFGVPSARRALEAHERPALSSGETLGAEAVKSLVIDTLRELEEGAGRGPRT